MATTSSSSDPPAWDSGLKLARADGFPSGQGTRALLSPPRPGRRRRDLRRQRPRPLRLCAAVPGDGRGGLGGWRRRGAARGVGAGGLPRGRARRGVGGDARGGAAGSECRAPSISAWRWWRSRSRPARGMAASWWLMGWRFMAGVAGGLLMALAGPAVQASVAPARRGAAGGVVIAGVGSGVAAGALLVPALLPVGLPATWIGLGAAVLLLWAIRAPALAGPAFGEARCAGRGRRRPARRPWCSPTGCTARAWCRRWSTWPTSRRAGAASGSMGRAGLAALRPRAAWRAACCRGGSWTVSAASRRCGCGSACRWRRSPCRCRLSPCWCRPRRCWPASPRSASPP